MELVKVQSFLQGVVQMIKQSLPCLFGAMKYYVKLGGVNYHL